MSRLQPTRSDMEMGGMQWEVTPPEELREGHVLRMTCVEDYSQEPGYPILDRTTITKLDGGSVHVAFDSERPNDNHYQASHEFQPGALRAIIDHVELSGSEAEQPSRSAEQGWLSRLLGRRSLPTAQSR